MLDEKLSASESYIGKLNNKINKLEGKPGQFKLQEFKSQFQSQVSVDLSEREEICRRL